MTKIFLWKGYYWQGNEKNYPNIQLVWGNVQQSYISEKLKMVNFSLVQCFDVENNINTWLLTLASKHPQ